MNKIRLSFIHLTQVPILEQLAIEEALLRTDERNICLINHASPPAIVMGISGKTENFVDQNIWERSPVSLIKRFSGGGTVFIDPSTWFVTWIINSEDISVKICPKAIHQWAFERYQCAFPSLDLQLVENDYVIGEHKCAGNAQYLTKNRWLHHTSFLWDYDPENMRYLLMPKKRPSYRQDREHEAFLCRLCNHFPSFSEMKEAFIASLDSAFDVQSLDSLELKEILARPHRKSTAALYS